MLGYYAADYRRHRPGPLFSYTWIAISRPPYLTALALWFTYWSGVSFPDSRTFLLRGMDNLADGYTLPSPLRVRELPFQWDRWRDRGWQCTSGERVSAFRLSGVPDLSGIPDTYEKSVAAGMVLLELRQFQDGRQTYGLRNRESGATVPLHVEQAEVDSSGRLILVKGGKLFKAEVEPDLTRVDTELADFNDMVFESVAPPDWATKWPFYDPEPSC